MCEPLKKKNYKFMNAIWTDFCQILKNPLTFPKFYSGISFLRIQKKDLFRTYSSSSLHVIIACNHLPLFKKIFKFCTFLPKFWNILPSFLKIIPMTLISRIGPAFNLFDHDSNCFYWSHLKRLISVRFVLVYLLNRFISTK